jgi:hypothetical protein
MMNSESEQDGNKPKQLIETEIAKIKCTKAAQRNFNGKLTEDEQTISSLYHRND